MLPTSTLLTSLLTRGGAGVSQALRRVVLQRHVRIFRVRLGLGVKASLGDLALIELHGVRPQDALPLSTRSLPQ